MSARSCSRSGSAARARCSSRSGLRPAFQASMKSLRMRSGSGGTEDLLQFLHTAAAALVDVVVRDAEAFGDRVAVELLDVRELEHLAVVVVAQAADGPVDERLGLLPALLLEVRVVGAGAQLSVVGGDRGVVRAAVAAVVPRRVEAAGGVLLVAQLLAPEVQAREVHDADHGRAELAELALAESRAHRDDAQVRLRRGAVGVVAWQPGPAREAEAAAEDLDPVEVVLGEALPDLRRLVVAPAIAGDGVAAQQEMVGFVGHSLQESRVAWRSDTSSVTSVTHAGAQSGDIMSDEVACKLPPPSGGHSGPRIRERAAKTPTTRRCRRPQRAHGPPSETA